MSESLSSKTKGHFEGNRYERNVYELLDNFAEVPVEILCCIIEKLTAQDLLSLSQVCSLALTILHHVATMASRTMSYPY